jgi:dipeptidyl aminopeptidase/acylaminoacyl peptidase
VKLEEMTFDAEGTRLSGWLAKPETAGPHPIVVMSHGLSGIAALDLPNYAEYFRAAGFACFAYDHRNWGKSAGWPRCESDPWRQVADMREAISFARTIPGIDGDRLGLWGTSYAGGHVLTVSALDRRVRCAVSQVPLISGRRTFDAWVPKDKRARFLERLAEDRDARAAGALPASTPAALPGTETHEWIEANDTEGAYENRLTVRSFDLLRSYEPVSFLADIAPTPLMMIIADRDTQTPTEWQVEAMKLAGDPSELVRLDCRHYDVYMDKLSDAAEAATGWFRKHLGVSD